MFIIMNKMKKVIPSLKNKGLFLQHKLMPEMDKMAKEFAENQKKAEPAKTAAPPAPAATTTPAEKPATEAAK